MKKRLFAAALTVLSVFSGCKKEEISSLVAISTATVTEITSESAVCGGSITDDGGSRITTYGVCWSTKETPTVADSKTEDGSGTGEWVSYITGLTPGSVYYVRAYGVNADGVHYGEARMFSAGAVVPVVTTLAMSDVTYESAVASGEVTFDGGVAVTEVGVCWGTEENPTVDGNYAVGELGGDNKFSIAIEGLEPDNTYYVRVYAKNAEGIGYGQQVSFGTSTETVIDEFTDKALWNHVVENYDLNGDKKIQISEAELVSTINLPEAGVTTIEGLAACPNISDLRLNNNALVAVDLTPFKSLETFWGFGNADLAEVNISGLSSLLYLHLYDTKVASLNLSDAVALAELNVYRTNIETLDLTYCSALGILNCEGTAIKGIDVSNKESLTYLNLNDCSALESLDVSGCTALKQLYLKGTPLMKIDAGNLPALETLWAFDLTSTGCELNVDNCPSLLYVHAYRSNMGAMSAKNCPLLTEFRCFTNPDVASVDFTGSFTTNKAEINLDGSHLTSLTIDPDNTVYYLNICQNRLKTLDLSGGFKNLQKLYANGSALEYINISGLPLLDDFNSNDNIPENSLVIKADNCPVLVNLLCQNSKAKEVTATNCPKLSIYRCYGNPSLTSVDLTGCPEIKEINVDGAPLTRFVLPEGGCPNLWYINIHKNCLTSVDLSSLTALTALHCGNAKLLTDIKYASTLKEIYHFNNTALETVDVSGLSDLTTLWSYGDDNADNQAGVKNLIFSGNGNLKILRAFRTKLESVDIRSCADEMEQAWFDANNYLTKLTKRAGQTIADLHVDAGCEVVEL